MEPTRRTRLVASHQAPGLLEFENQYVGAATETKHTFRYTLVVAVNAGDLEDNEEDKDGRSRRSLTWQKFELFVSSGIQNLRWNLVVAPLPKAISATRQGFPGPEAYTTLKCKTIGLANGRTIRPCYGSFYWPESTKDNSIFLIQPEILKDLELLPSRHHLLELEEAIRESEQRIPNNYDQLKRRLKENRHTETKKLQ
ncbi:hypothetical protein ILUMI_02277 [Ignelater luminosus]|uniref:Uncharacterized protein n=1 Tax=Ignelater luminosus TaxID=2038154 RepID=A0A8K0GJF0_IGNLU|nr:hypothetical protein ILUMI_02277 [Ignelater luminosus]